MVYVFGVRVISPLPQDVFGKHVERRACTAGGRD